MRRAAHRLLAAASVAATALLATAPAGAQDIFMTAGAPHLEPLVPGEPEVRVLVAPWIDDAGFAYESVSNCRPLDDEFAYIPGPFSAREPFVEGAVRNNGQGVFVMNDVAGELTFDSRRCAPGPEPDDPRPDSWFVVPAARNAMVSDPNPIDEMLQGWNDDVCFRRAMRFYCADPDAAEPAVTLRWDFADLSDLPWHPFWQSRLGWWVDEELVVLERNWRVLPDGRLVVAIQRSLIGMPTSPNGPPAAGISARAVVIRGTEDEPILFRDEGVLTRRSWNHHFDFIWDDQLQAVLYTVQGWDMGNFIVHLLIVGLQDVLVPRGWDGIGLRALAVDGGFGWGYLSVTDAVVSMFPAIAEGQVDDHDTRNVGIYADGMGGVLLSYDSYMHRLEWDYDLLDLDSDGLRAYEEREAGTSDFFDDSDGDGFSDPMEFRVTGTDPTDGNDLWPVMFDQIMPVFWDMSPLVRARIGAGVHDPEAYVDFQSAYSHDRSVRWFQDTDRSLYSQRMPDGEPTLQLAGTRPELTDGGPLWLFPVDERLAYAVTSRDPTNFVYWIEDGQLTTLFDEAQATLESAQFDATGYVRYERHLSPRHVIESIEPIGYVAELDRLYIAVNATWDLYIVALHPDESPAIIRTARGMTGFQQAVWVAMPDWQMSTSAWDGHGPPLVDAPTFMMPSGHGDYLTNFGNFLPWYVHTGGFRGVSPPNPHTSGRAFVDSVLTSYCCGTAEDGAYEWVRVEWRVDPGDTLWLVAEQDPLPDPVLGIERQTMLYKVNARGGVMRLWEEPVTSIDRATGMNVGPNGEVCIADRDAGWLWEYVPEDQRRIPSGLGASGPAGVIVDCLYDADSNIFMLLDEPPRIEVWDRETQQTSLQETLDAGVIPIQLHWAPDGALEVVDAAHSSGGAYDSQGRWITVRNGGVYRDDERLGDVGAVLRDGLHVPVPLLAETRFRVGARNDGFITLLGYWPDATERPRILADPQHFNNPLAAHVAAFEPASGETFMYTMPRITDPYWVVMAHVPGGPAVDPWTYEPVVEGEPGQGGGAGGGEPTAPTGGSAVTYDEGCACAAASPGAERSAAWMLALLAVVLCPHRRGDARDQNPTPRRNLMLRCAHHVLALLLACSLTASAAAQEQGLDGFWYTDDDALGPVRLSVMEGRFLSTTPVGEHTFTQQGASNVVLEPLDAEHHVYRLG